MRDILPHSHSREIYLIKGSTITYGRDFCFASVLEYRVCCTLWSKLGMWSNRTNLKCKYTCLVCNFRCMGLDRSPKYHFVYIAVQFYDEIILLPSDIFWIHWQVLNTHQSHFGWLSGVCPSNSWLRMYQSTPLQVYNINKRDSRPIYFILHLPSSGFASCMAFPNAVASLRSILFNVTKSSRGFWVYVPHKPHVLPKRSSDT